MQPKVQVFAVIRVDADAPPAPGSSGPGVSMARFRDLTIRDVSVVTVLPTMEEAMREVDRLDALNASKGCTYFWMATRYYPEGRAIDAGDD
jgi:hypothetical protein